MVTPMGLERPEYGNVTVPVLRSIRPTLLPPWFATKAKLPSGATAAEMGVENPEYGQVIVLVSMLILPTLLPSQVRPKVPQGAIEISYGVLLENPVNGNDSFSCEAAPNAGEAKDGLLRPS